MLKRRQVRTLIPVVNASSRLPTLFRIFNPVVQGRRLDPNGTFVRTRLPVLRSVPTKYVHAQWQMVPHLQRGSLCDEGARARGFCGGIGEMKQRT